MEIIKTRVPDFILERCVVAGGGICFDVYSKTDSGHFSIEAFSPYFANNVAFKIYLKE